MSLGSVRREELSLSFVEAREILLKGEFGVLSTVDEDAQPYGVALNYAFDGVDRIFFHSALEGHKIDNIRSSPRVSFCVVGENRVVPECLSSHYRSVVGFGVAGIVTDVGVKRRGLELLMKKYSSEYVCDTLGSSDLSKVVVIEVVVDTITGKKSKD